MRNAPSRCLWAASVPAALALWLAVPVILEVNADAPGADQTPGSPVPPQGPLAVRVTAPTMNADVGAGTAIILAAAPTTAGSAITKVEFLDDGQLVV